MKKHTLGNWRHGLLLILSGLMLWAAWPMSPLTGLIFVAFVPLLMVENRMKSPYGYFFVLWLNFFIWNAGTTWWIWNSTGPGAVGAILANSLLMCFPWMLYRSTKRRLGTSTGLVALVVYWLTFEYIHHNWDLTWPWLTLGNAFATHTEWVRWYAYTGTTGGSLWVLTINVMVYSWLFGRKGGPLAHAMPLKANPAAALLPVLLFVIPIGWSLLAWPQTTTTPAAAGQPNVVAVQPNVEPYNEKFSTDKQVLIARLIQLTESVADTNTRLVLWPETAIPSTGGSVMWEDQLEQNPAILQVREFLNRHPQLLLVTGIDGYRSFGNQNPGRFSVRESDGMYYEAYNSAASLAANMPASIYHKSKLVPGVEALPRWLGFMGSLFNDFGGISGSLGRNDSAVVFGMAGNPYAPAPIICYESIFSDYTTDYVRRGANILTIVTNDGWWGNTPGHRQHMAYARLRAIETGLWVARSANTGISCFISPHGDIFQAQPWDTAAAIKLAIPAARETTWYARTGDWLSRVCWPLACLLLLATVALRFTKRRISPAN